MSELFITRALPVPLEPIGDGWTVRGLAVPYGVETAVSDDGETFYFEEFERGAFARDVSKGGLWINLMLGHAGDDGDRYLGRCVALEEFDDGLYPAFRLNRSHPQAEEARSGELTGWSVGARAYKSRRETRGGRDVTIRMQAGLNHVAATRSPQYAGAGVLVARDHEMLTPPATPLLDAARARLDALRTAR
jgi:HK97 family phage prohead protease